MKRQTQDKLEYKLLYSLVVAGKNATFAENVMKKFLSYAGYDYTANPMALVRMLVKNGGLMSHLLDCRTGNYQKLQHAFETVAFAVGGGVLNLKTCTPQDLEAIKGIGPKTSRFFLLWTRKNEQYAALDTHILKWLRYLGHDAPKTTPTGKKYAELEEAFLEEVEKRKTVTSKLDYQIWEWCRDHAKPGVDYMKDSFWPKALRRR